MKVPLSIALSIALAGCGSSPPPAAPAPASAPAEQPAPGAPAPIVDQGTIRSRFRDCGDGFIGQVLEAPGVRCAAVCATFGYSRCRGRAGQASFEACREQHDVVGPCDQPFEAGQRAQCDCTNRPLPTTAPG